MKYTNEEVRPPVQGDFSPVWVGDGEGGRYGSDCCGEKVMPEGNEFRCVRCMTHCDTVEVV